MLYECEIPLCHTRDVRVRVRVGLGLGLGLGLGKLANSLERVQESPHNSCVCDIQTSFGSIGSIILTLTLTLTIQNLNMHIGWHP